MRKIFAQSPSHPAARVPSVVPIFQGFEKEVQVRARRMELETDREKESFVMPLQDKDRRSEGSPAVVQSLKEFRTNFNVFSESSLVNMNWDNVVVAGSAVVTSLLAVPDKHNCSKRALREYYHEQLAPASDVDLFLYGVTEDEAVEKIKQIEQCIRDAILVETTTIRTKNAVTIASQYPTRHVQIVLRVYSSISEILTGFDVDCSCAAYDGHQVYASPRALAAYMTQINTIDLTRRSPSYENRLSKYAHRGFEVYWPNLDRSRIDPTIFERSFGRTEGLARLLILEKLPNSRDRDAYMDQRRAERGRPVINRWRLNRRQIHGNIKNNHEDEVAEWVEVEEVSDYHTFTVPYGSRFNARKIEQLLYAKDLLLNSEWNRPKDREVNLHRHPAFFGRASDVIGDCCGFCPSPVSVEEEEAAEEEAKVYVSGAIRFIKDDPGRQSIGSFNPLTADDWTEMAYVGNTEQFCRAIVDGDAEFVAAWLTQEGNDPNTRDYTGRTPLHLAVIDSTMEIVQLLIGHGARIVARLVDGRTALHLAAMRGNVDMISALLRKSEANEEEEQKKLDARRATRAAAKDPKGIGAALQGATIRDEQSSDDNDEGIFDVDMVDVQLEGDLDAIDVDATTEDSMVNIKSFARTVSESALDTEDDKDRPDVYDVNVLAWDTAVSPLHLAIVNGHVDVVRLLVSEFGADVLMPIKLFNDYDKSARAAILTLVLALQLPFEKAEEMVRTLIRLGASVAQADIDQHTVLHTSVVDCPEMLETLRDADRTGFDRSINHLSAAGPPYHIDVRSPLMTAIKAQDSLTALMLLSHGSKVAVDFSAYIKAYKTKREPPNDPKRNKQDFETSIQQPVVTAVDCELPNLVKVLVEQHDVDPNTLSDIAYSVIHNEWSRSYNRGESLLDRVRAKIKELKEWGPSSEDSPDEPISLQPDATYLSGYPKGSYKLWTAQKQLIEAQQKYEEDLKQFNTRMQSSQYAHGLQKKQAAVENLQREFEQVEAFLLERGAKTFSELHPDIKGPDIHHNYSRWRPNKPKPFQVDITYRLSDLTDEARDRYTKLFEAAWNGDLATVKELATTSWRNQNGDIQAPLQIAVQDQCLLSPFSVALLQGHHEMLSDLLKLASAQFVPPDELRKQRYGIDGREDNAYSDLEDSEPDCEEVRLYSEVADAEFTVDNVGEFSLEVKSRVKALTMLSWPCPAGDFLEAAQSGSKRQFTMAGKRSSTGTLRASNNHLSAEKRKEIGPPSNLFQFALHTDDQNLLTWLLSVGEEYTAADTKSDDDDTQKSFAISRADFLEAIKLDRPHLLAEIIKSTGAGIPLDKLVSKSGIELKEKPKYYQGLSVYGKKRKAWANKGRDVSYQPVENYQPPLLEAAYHASVDTIEWLLSDAPMRAYKQFAKFHPDDPRVKALSEGKGGFEAAVARFLGGRSNLAIHCCLLGKPVPETIEVLRFLINAMPDAIDHKSIDGVTPLHISFRFLREEAARILIDASADQTARDKSGQNIFHNLLMETYDCKAGLKKFPAMIELIDQRLIKDLLAQRSSANPGALTPLAQWVKRSKNLPAEQHVCDVVKLLVKLGGGGELNIIDGEGHSPIHDAVCGNMPLLTKTILEIDPTLVMREDCTGRTVYEMAENDAIAAVCDEPTVFPDKYNTNNLVKRQPESFVEKETKEQSDQEKVWASLKDTKAKLEEQGRLKRRLVTLNEANEVARRLARRSSGNCRPTVGSVRDGDEAEKKAELEEIQTDEVRLWLPQARTWLEDAGKQEEN